MTCINDNMDKIWPTRSQNGSRNEIILQELRRGKRADCNLSKPQSNIDHPLESEVRLEHHFKHLTASASNRESLSYCDHNLSAWSKSKSGPECLLSDLSNHKLNSTKHHSLELSQKLASHRSSLHPVQAMMHITALHQEMNHSHD